MHKFHGGQNKSTRESMNLQCTAMFLLNALLISGVNEVIWNTEYGRVRGILSAEGQSYLGIPYGKAERFDLFIFF